MVKCNIVRIDPECVVCLNVMQCFHRLPYSKHLHPYSNVVYLINQSKATAIHTYISYIYIYIWIVKQANACMHFLEYLHPKVKTTLVNEMVFLSLLGQLLKQLVRES